MLTTALRTLRTRWTTFVGSFLALALEVGLIATMGLALAASLDAPAQRPERFAAARVVVSGTDTLRVPTRIGDRVQRLDRPRPLAALLAGELARLGRVVEDRSFPVRAQGAPAELVGHPWSTAAFAPYHVTAGRAPRRDGEVAVSGGWTTPGALLRTDRGVQRVVGTVAAGGFEQAVFYPDAVAARLSPRVDQLVVDAAPTAVREALRDRPGVRVLAGAELRYADADPDRDREALVTVNALLGTAAGVTGFVSVFVVASTFAFAVARRRREFGLLRTAGATPGQTRAMVLAEAVCVGVPAAAAGCALGAHGAPLLTGLLVDEGLAPRWFTVGGAVWPYHLAFWSGVLVALAGAAAASWRAGRTGPADALREASVDARTMTAGRWSAGTGLLLVGVGLLAWALLTDPGELLHRKSYTSRPMLLIVAFGVLAPALVRPLARLLARLSAGLPGAVGMLAGANTASGVRRTAAVAAPVLVTVALAGSLLGTTATLNAAKGAEAQERTSADLVVDGADLDPAAVARLRRVPGAEVSVTAQSAVFRLEDGVALIRSDARAADPAPLARTARLPVVAGDPRGLDDGSIIVNEEWARHTVGDRVPVWLGDGTRRTLRVAAVLRTGTGDNGAYVTWANAPGARADHAEVRLCAGARAATVARELRRAVRGTGAVVLTRDAWLRSTRPGGDRTTRVGFLLVLGIALLYTGIAVANTTVMAASDRGRELAALRLAGATRAQVLRLVTAEALVVVGLGAVLGTLVAVLDVAGVWTALGILRVRTPLVLPWDSMVLVVAVCALVAVVCALVATVVLLLRGPAGMAGTRE